MIRKLLEKLRELAAKKPAAEVLKKMNKKGEVVSVMERLTEKGKVKELGDKWAAGLMTDAKTDAGTKTATFYKIEAIVPPTPKALNEALKLCCWPTTRTTSKNSGSKTCA